jgi:Zn-dependent protease
VSSLDDSSGASGAPPPTPACPGCGTELGPSLLECPLCHRLVHAERLRALAAQAEQATRAGDDSKALATWREALELLPPSSRQSLWVGERVAEISARVDQRSGTGQPQPAGPPPGSTWAKWLAPFGALGLLLWKLKLVIAFAAGKAKLLLGGLTKSSTLFSMLASLGVYWTAWGWWFALGLVLSLYVHEMGHVAALRRFGIAASAPMFVPGFGAFVRLKQYPSSPREDARVGLAGPLWGFGAALFALVLFHVTKQPLFAAIAKVGAWINLFNLLPIWQLDGGRGFRALSRADRWLATAGVGLCWLATEHGLLVLLALAGALNALSAAPARETDRRAFVEYVGLVVVLSLLAALPTPV